MHIENDGSGIVEQKNGNMKRRNVNHIMSDDELRIIDNFKFRKATFEQFCDLTYLMVQEGQMSFGDYALITLNPELPPQKESADPDHFFLTKKDSHGNRNWMKELMYRAERQKQIGDTEGYKRYREIIHQINEFIH